MQNTFILKVCYNTDKYSLNDFVAFYNFTGLWFRSSEMLQDLICDGIEISILN